MQQLPYDRPTVPPFPTTPEPIEHFAPELWGELNARDPENYPIPDLEVYRNARAATLRAGYDAQIKALSETYFPEEQKTWTLQVIEAERWMADHAQPTPLLTGIATSRGMPLQDLVERVLRNDASYRAEVGRLLGEQQAALEALYS